jgi:hypothetical protein
MFASLQIKKAADGAFLPRRRPPSALVSRKGASQTLALARELYLFSGQLSQNGDAVLNAEALDLAIPQLATESYEFAPRGRQPIVSIFRLLHQGGLHT